jgi:hypothetical protein
MLPHVPYRIVQGTVETIRNTKTTFMIVAASPQCVEKTIVAYGPASEQVAMCSSSLTNKLSLLCTTYLFCLVQEGEPSREDPVLGPGECGLRRESGHPSYQQNAEG